MQDEESGIWIDIQNSTPDGLETSKFVRRQLELYPEMKPIVLVLKQQLKLHNFNETYTGGMASYTLLCLVISYFQQFYASGCNDILLGEHLFNFYRIFSDDFKHDELGISVRENGFVFLREDSDLQTGSLICVENPTQPSKDLGLGVRDMKTIQQLWVQTLNSIYDLKTTPDKSILKNIVFGKHPRMHLL